jgi:putative transcriptional regulator
MLWVGVLLLAPLFVTEAAPQRASLAGQLLVASPDIGDPRFRHAVILMVQHDSKGALGIVINRPVEELPLAKLMQALGQDAKGIVGTVRIYAGGPVQPQKGFIVHGAEYHRAETIDIDGRLAVTGSPEVLRDIGHGNGPKQSLVAFGYAGWGPGQLESELAKDGWFTVKADSHLVFDVDREKLWDEAMKRRTISL